MSKVRKTGFDRYVERRMADPDFAGAYAEARGRIDAIDHVVQSLDSAREERGLSKAELARMIGVRPESIRRLFSTPSPNPTLDTVVAVAQALELRVRVEPERRSSSRSRKAAALAP
jgi:DNA-binding phage protein